MSYAKIIITTTRFNHSCGIICTSNDYNIFLSFSHMYKTVIYNYSNKKLKKKQLNLQFLKIMDLNRFVLFIIQNKIAILCFLFATVSSVRSFLMIFEVICSSLIETGLQMEFHYRYKLCF